MKLVNASGEGTNTEQGFTITAQQGAATMGRSGLLVVRKTDIGDNLLPGAEFTIYNTNADGSKGSARAVRTTATDGIVRFYGLVPGNYILVETQAPGGDYEAPALEYSVVVDSELKTTVNGSDTITVGAPFSVVNYRPVDQVGSLSISKLVAGGADSTKTFDFTLTLTGAPGTYTYVGRGVPGGTIKSGDTVSLAHGQSITIVGLPNGATYKVTEENDANVRYTVTSTGATGAIVTGTTQTAAFTNTRYVPVPSPDTGNLTISKTVTGQGADITKKFDFTVTFVGASDVYLYVGTATGTIRSGDTISLADGESITIIGLPADAQYTVTEADYAEVGYIPTSTGAVGTIAVGESRIAAFTNSHGNTPDEPTTPEDPTDDTDDGDTPPGPIDGDGEGMPQTGDTQVGAPAKLGLLFFSAALMGLITTDFALRKRYSREGNRK